MTTCPLLPDMARVGVVVYDRALGMRGVITQIRAGAAGEVEITANLFDDPGSVVDTPCGFRVDLTHELSEQAVASYIAERVGLTRRGAAIFPEDPYHGAWVMWAHRGLVRFSPSAAPTSNWSTYTVPGLAYIGDVDDARLQALATIAGHLHQRASA